MSFSRIMKASSFNCVGVLTYTALLCLVVSVGFDRDDYRCALRGSVRCEVCVGIHDSTSLDPTLSLSLSLTTISATALGNDKLWEMQLLSNNIVLAASLDFIEIDDTLTLSSVQPRVCVVVEILERERFGSEHLYFGCILTWIAQLISFSNVVLNPEVATVTIKSYLDGQCFPVRD